MSILSPTATGPGLATAAGASVGGGGSAALAKTSADFNMFLKMLTTQMQNQDPLDPMDTSEYTNQLVQFSQVEQTIQQTGTLKDILSRLTTQDMAQASGFIGREAQFASGTSGLSATAPATWGYAAARPVESLVATITNAAGVVVDTRAIDEEGGDTKGMAGRFAWDGKLPNGARAADGAYTLAFAGVDAAGNRVPVTVTSIGTVGEVVTAGGSVSLGVNGVQLPASTLLRVSQGV